MGARANLPPAAYPSQAVVERMIAAARKAGLDPAGFEASRDGTVRIIEARAMPDQPGSLFDELDQLGKL